MTKIRVVMLCYIKVDDYNVPHTGSKIYEDRLIYYISQTEKVDLNIITIGNKNMVIEKSGVKYHVIDKKDSILKNFFYWPFLLLKIRKKIIEIQPDLVHVFSTTLFYSIVTINLKKKYHFTDGIRDFCQRKSIS